MARLDDLLRAEKLGILDRVQGGAADLNRARGAGLTPALEDDYPTPELTPEQQEMARQGQATAAEGGFSLDQGVRKAEALQAEPALKRAATAYGGAMYGTGRALQQMVGMDLSPEQEEEVRAQRELWESGGAAAKAGKIGGEFAQLVAPGAALEKGALKAMKGLPHALTLLNLPTRLAATGAAEGAIAGAIQPTLEGESRAENVAAGAGVGAGIGGALGVGGKILKVAGRPFKPTVTAARQMAKDVQPTLGQGAAWNIGGWKPLQKLENSLRLLTGRGQLRGRQEAAHDLMKAANPIDDVPLNITPGASKDEMQAAFTQLKANHQKAYAAVGDIVEREPNILSVTQPLTRVWEQFDKALGIPPSKVKQLMGFVEEKFGELMKGRVKTAGVKIKFEDYRELREWFTDQIAKRKGPANLDIDQRHIRDMLYGLKETMTNNVEKFYGKAAAAELKRVDGKYHLYKLFEDAGEKKGGVTIDSLDAAIKKWYDKGTYVTGRGAMQPEIAALNRAMPAPEGGAWGGMALMGHLAATIGTGGAGGLPGFMAIVGSTRPGARALLGGTKKQKQLLRAMNKYGKKYRGGPSALAGALAAQTGFQEE